MKRVTPHLKIGKEQQAHNQNELRRNHSDYDSALDGTTPYHFLRR
jgi:hypothetical protein